MFKALCSKKQVIFKSLLIIWLVLATGYILFDLYSRYRLSTMQQAYNVGVTNTVDSLIKQAEQSNCQPFEVFSGEKKVSLLDVKCLEPKTGTTTTPKE